MFQFFTIVLNICITYLQEFFIVNLIYQAKKQFFIVATRLRPSPTKTRPRLAPRSPPDLIGL